MLSLENNNYRFEPIHWRFLPKVVRQATLKLRDNFQTVQKKKAGLIWGQLCFDDVPTCEVWRYGGRDGVPKRRDAVEYNCH